jgi:hypothetical protein
VNVGAPLNAQQDIEETDEDSDNEPKFESKYLEGD